VEEERIRQLHQESFIWDFFPEGEMPLMKPRIQRVLEECLEAELSSPALLEAIDYARIQELEENPTFREQMADWWRQSGVNCVCVTVEGLEASPGDTGRLMRDIARWHRRIQASGYMALVTGARSAEEVWRQGQVGIVFCMQDPVQLLQDLSILDALHGLGVRIIQITYNQRNFIGDGCTERTQTGLSHFGVEFVHRMNALGIVIDLSHCGYQTTLDAIEVSERPVAVTHSFCRALRDHPRGKSDAQLRLLAERDGYMGILAVPFFLADEPYPSISLVLDHIDHAVGIMGLKRVGIGTDWSGFSPDAPDWLREAIARSMSRMGFRPGHGTDTAVRPGGAYFLEMKHYTDWLAITRGLANRGYGEEAIRDVLGRNWLNFLQRTGLE
jgi:membrane dipeptidase